MTGSYMFGHHAALLLATAIGLTTTLGGQAVPVVTTPFRGVTYYQEGGSWKLLKIDLHDPGIQVFVTEPNGAAQGDTNLETTPAFVARKQSQIGINASYFDNSTEAQIRGNTTVVGPAASLGLSYGSTDYRWAMNIASDKTVSFMPGNPFPNGLYNAVAGDRIVIDGVVIPAAGGALANRTSYGVDSSGRYLLLFVGESMTGREPAEILQAYGAWTANWMDGGGSTTLVLDYYDDGLGPQKVFGGTRRVGNNLAIYANRTSDPLIVVTFESQGGTVSPTSCYVTNGMAYGALPTPTRAVYAFGGWWTGADGAGSHVIASTVVTSTTSHTLYAKWEAIPVVPAFEASFSTGRAPFAVTFDDGSTGTITNRHWDFGDGTWTNTMSTNLVHIYTNAGVYTVMLVVSGPLGSGTNTWGQPVVVYGLFANSIPYQCTFEPPEWHDGDSLFVPWNSNGWAGGPDSGAFVTNLSYAWPSSNYPVTASTHSNVLVFQDAALTNQLAQAGSPSHVVVDLMNQSGGRETLVPDANDLAGAQMSLYADPDGPLNVWCSGDQAHTNRTWVTYAGTFMGETNWARLTVAFDYTSDKVNGLTYFSVALNGVALPVPGGMGYAYAGGGFTRSPGGIWLVSANPAEKK